MAVKEIEDSVAAYVPWLERSNLDDEAVEEIVLEDVECAPASPRLGVLVLQDDVGGNVEMLTFSALLA